MFMTVLFSTQDKAFKHETNFDLFAPHHPLFTNASHTDLAKGDCGFGKC